MRISVESVEEVAEEDMKMLTGGRSDDKGAGRDTDWRWEWTGE